MVRVSKGKGFALGVCKDGHICWLRVVSQNELMNFLLPSMSGSDISMNKTVPSWSNFYRSKLPNTRGTTYSILFVHNNQFSSIVHLIVTLHTSAQQNTEW